MRKRLLVPVLLCALSGPLMADMINVGDKIRFYDKEGTVGGGEYGVAMAGTPNKPELFRSFCLQHSEYLDFSPAGFEVVGITAYAEPEHDKVDPRTAYLYTQFRQGTLSGYVYTSGGAAGGPWDHVDSANELQRAIWGLEGETAMPVTGKAADWIAEATNAVNLGQWIGLGQVRVLNIVWATNRSYPAGTPAQDVLVMSPVPAPGAALLAGIGVTLIGWFRRRIA